MILLIFCLKSVSKCFTKDQIEDIGLNDVILKYCFIKL